MDDDLFTAVPPVEPSSEMRQMALMMRGAYVAYREAGFTEGQAMDLLKAQIIGAAGANSGE